jgi:hypothetical protein
VAKALGARAAFTGRSLHALREVPEAVAALGEMKAPARRAMACLTALLLGRGVTADGVSERLHLDRFAARELRSAERYLRLWPGGFGPARRDGDLREQLREAGFGAVAALWLTAPDEDAREALAHYWRTLRQVRADISATQFKALGHRPGPAYNHALQAAIRAKLNDGADAAAQFETARQTLEHHQMQGEQ